MPPSQRRPEWSVIAPIKASSACRWEFTQKDTSMSREHKLREEDRKGGDATDDERAGEGDDTTEAESSVVDSDDDPDQRDRGRP